MSTAILLRHDGVAPSALAYEFPFDVDGRDFDIARLARDMRKRHPKIPGRQVESFMPFAVLIYYLK